MQKVAPSLASYCTVALLALALAPATAAQQAVQLAEGESELTVFIRGARAGNETVRVSRSGTTWVVTSTGSIGVQSGAAKSRFEVKYTPDLHPMESRLEISQSNRSLTVATSYGGTTAINEITQNGTTTSKTDQISARTIVLPNNFYAAYAVLAARLANAEPGADLPAYITPQAEVRVTVKAVTPEQIQGPTGPVATTRFSLSFQNPGGPLEASLTTDDRSRLLRLEIPAAGLSVVRSEFASVATRLQPVRNANDRDVTIPAAGFNLAGTLTVPSTGRIRHPAIVLVAGSGRVDRDETVAEIPIFAQLAGRLAEQGYLVLRYDKRGVGQSGGRVERVTLQDYAEDLIAAVRWLDKRDDVDRKRIAVAGHSEGGSVGLLAASREKKIASLILIASIGTTGAELILEQQQHVLGVLKTPDAERQAKVDLQKRIHDAVINGQWEGIPEDLREQADTPLFRSLLLFDPAKVMPKVRQPLLIIQPELDRQVPAHHADTLAELARARKKGGVVEVVRLPGVNHLLARATTGEVSEYTSLPEKAIVPGVADAIVNWLQK